MGRSFCLPGSDGEMRRWGDEESGRGGEGEMRRWSDGEIGR